MRPIALMFVLLPLSTVSLAQAQEDPGQRRVKYQERTEIEFGELDVTASADGPLIRLVAERLAPEGGSLIELRDNFNDAMAESVDAVK